MPITSNIVGLHIKQSISSLLFNFATIRYIIVVFVPTQLCHQNPIGLSAVRSHSGGILSI